MQDFIIEKIKNTSDQLITYAEYIELALYHPTKGYYMREEMKIGKSGDFITTSNVSDIFGSIFSKWFLKQVEDNEITPTVCEIGAGNGRFAHAFLDHWVKHTDIPITYYIVETSPYHRQLQKEILPIGNNVIHIDKISEITPFQGLIFSNELFDALPVHVIKKTAGDLYEVMIGIDKNGLKEELIPLSNPKIIDYLNSQKISLSNNQRFEIPLEMENVLKSISQTMEKGLVVTIDYGYTNNEWMEPARKSGSLRGYYKHQMISEILLNPGEMDITHHIHFDGLISKGEQLGLNFITMKRQDEFLIAAGILNELEENYDPNPFSERSKRNRAIRSLILPGMSSFFHIIIQEKETELIEGNLF
jgi:SAM-dependent MidA family methyltransferase